jgi:hypothetical protein
LLFAGAVIESSPRPRTEAEAETTMKLFKTRELNLLHDLLERLRDLSESVERREAESRNDPTVITEKHELARLLEHPEVTRILSTDHELGADTDEVLPFIILLRNTAQEPN